MSWSVPASGCSTFFGPTATTIVQILNGAVAVGDLIVVYSDWSASVDEGGSVTCADDLGNTYTNIGHSFETANEAAAIFECFVTHAGTPTLTVTLPATRTNRGISAQTYRSSNGTPTRNTLNIPVGASAISGAGPDNMTGPALTTTVDGCLVVACYPNISNLNAFSAGTGWTGDQTATSSQIITHKIQATQGGITPTGTSAGSSGHYFTCGIAYQEPAAGGGGTTLDTFPTTGILDAFNRGSLGSNWTTPSLDTAGSGVTIIGNQVTSAGGDPFAMWNQNVWGPDTEAWITVVTLPLTNNWTMLSIRNTDSGVSTTYSNYSLRYTPNGTVWDLRKGIVGVFTSMGTNTSVTVSPGDGVGIRALGNKISAWYRAGAVGNVWTKVFEVTNSEITAAGYIGFMTGDTTGRWDDFGGGTYGLPELALLGVGAH